MRKLVNRRMFEAFKRFTKLAKDLAFFKKFMVEREFFLYNVADRMLDHKTDRYRDELVGK